MDNIKYQTWALTKDRNSYMTLGQRLQEKRLLRLVHAQMGIAGESGELTDSIKKSVMYGKPVDVDNLKEECGDILWYMAILLDEIGSSFEEVMKGNHDKLERRYPTGFNETDAIKRADKS